MWTAVDRANGTATVLVNQCRSGRVSRYRPSVCARRWRTHRTTTFRSDTLGTRTWRHRERDVEGIRLALVYLNDKTFSDGWRNALGTVLLVTLAASSAAAQDYSFDARRIGLGGAGGTPNVASKLVERQRRYKSILIPVGLVKLLTDIHVYYPNREDFDFSRAVEHSASPLHFVFGRREDITARSLFR